MKHKVSDKGGRYHHGDLRRALVDAAIELVHELGPSGITLREAARRAGVTHAAPYRHFADKGALLAAVAEHGFAQLREEIVRSLEAGGEPTLDLVGLAYVRFARDNPSQFRVMFGSQMGDKRAYPSLLEADQAVFDLLVAAIRQSQREGDLGDGDPVAMGMVAWPMAHGLAALAVDGQMERAGFTDAQVDNLTRRMVRTVRFGLKQWERQQRSG